MRGLVLLFFFCLVGALAVAPAAAGCQCACIGGRPKAICQSSLDVAPTCPARVCAMPSPDQRVDDPGRPSPRSAKQCRMEQVLNRAAGRYEWQQVCR
jgi:hypothetical protein